MQAQARELRAAAAPRRAEQLRRQLPEPERARAGCELRPHMDRFNQVVPIYCGGSSSESSSSVVSYSESP